MCKDDGKNTHVAYIQTDRKKNTKEPCTLQLIAVTAVRFQAGIASGLVQRSVRSAQLRQRGGYYT